MVRINVLAEINFLMITIRSVRPVITLVKLVWNLKKFLMVNYNTTVLLVF